MEITPQSRNPDILTGLNAGSLERPGPYVADDPPATHTSTSATHTSASHGVEAPPPSVPNYTSLSPDALMAYCEARLNSLDTQMSDIFTSQQKNATSTQDLNNIADSLNNLQAVTPATTPATVTVTNNDYNAIVNEYKTAILDAGKGSSLEVSLQGDLSTFENAAKSALSKDGTMSADTVASLSQDLKNDTANLNSDSEMTMINLQSLMSQRQTAVQLTTNLVQSLGDQSSDIAKNVGQ
jgi:hypothetical protein